MTSQDQDMSAWRRAASGAILIAIGAAIIGISWRYPLGTITQMGPGFIPQWAGLGLVALGIAVLISDLRADAIEPAEPMRWRAFMLISAGIMLFALLVTWLGLVPAMFISVSVSMLADEDATLLAILVYASVITVIGWALFITALGLPFSAVLV